MQQASTLLDTYRRAEECLTSGDLKQSADLCKQIIDTDPDFAHGYDLMAALFTSTGNLDKALMFAQMALKRAPDVPEFHMRHGQVHFSLGQWEEAAAAFERAHTLEPANPLHLVLWADTFTQRGQFEEAQALFHRARIINDIPEIDEHEGMCMIMKGDYLAAETLFDKLMRRRPDHYWGYIHKAKLLLKRNSTADAETCFSKALLIRPDAHDALHGMALVSEQKGDAKMAVRYAVQAIQAHPRSWATHALLGHLLMGQGSDEAAELVLRQAHSLKPDNMYLWQLLKSVLLGQKKKEDMVELIGKWLLKQPANMSLHYLRAMLAGENMDAPPPDYVASLFNGYAERYDYHMQKTLAYRIPRLMYDAVRLLLPAPGAPALSLLDLGCGTGLVGEAFSSTTALRIGVDLSERMLEKARARQLYASLYHLDMAEFMLASDRQFDVVAAADVLPYLGSLSLFMKNARNALGPQSLLAFTVEKGAEDFRLLESGRYTHSSPYIRRLAEDHGYVVLAEQPILMRGENLLPVEHALFILKKALTH